jgi:hypothetical protein
MRTALIIAGLLVSLAAQPQDIYRWVDKDGIVHYADQPGSPDAELVPFPGLDVAEAGADSTGEASPPEDQPSEPPAESAYGSMTIISPSPEAVFYGTDVSVPVQVALDADLRPGDTLVVFVDGQRSSEVSGLAATLTGLTRGTHLLQAAITDESGSVVITSQQVSFHVRQTSVATPNTGPALRPPPPRPTPRTGG